MFGCQLVSVGMLIVPEPTGRALERGTGGLESDTGWGHSFVTLKKEAHSTF